MFVKSYLSSGVAPGRSWFVGRAQRGDDKPRGRGRGRRNRNQERVLTERFDCSVKNMT